ncbi:MAG: hypothetical protein AABN95_09910 [Acidobacteriota bacterium]
MRTSAGLFLILVAATALQAQTPPVAPPSGVEVRAASWSKERIGWERDPFGGPIENFDEMRARARNEKRIDDAKRGGGGSGLDRVRREAQADAAILEKVRQKGPARYQFFYKASVKNISDKSIKVIDWDYIFFDAATGEELGRREFSSIEKIGAGRSKDLAFMISVPPTQRISLYALDKKERMGLTEKVVIMRVQYSDDSVWQHQ